MANVTKPIALDETFNTTEVTPRNTADVLAQELSAIASAVRPDAGDIPYDGTASGLTADDVQEAIDELSTNVSGKVSKSGDTMSGTLTLGSGGARGELDIKSTAGAYKTRIYNSTSNPLTADRALYLPDASGTVALEPTDESGDLLSYVQSGFTASANQVTYLKRGKLITIRVNGASPVATGDGIKLLGSLPAKFQPAIQTFVLATGAHAEVRGLAYVADLSLYVNVTVVGGMYFSITYQSI